MTKKIMTITTSMAIALLVPLVAMQFSDDVSWSLADFIVAGMLLFSFGLSIDYVLNKAKDRKARIIWTAVLVLFFLLLWIELAVGLFGTPFAGS